MCKLAPEQQETDTPNEVIVLEYLPVRVDLALVRVVEEFAEVALFGD